jgi:hypothetical protein
MASIPVSALVVDGLSTGGVILLDPSEELQSILLPPETTLETIKSAAEVMNKHMDDELQRMLDENE